MTHFEKAFNDLIMIEGGWSNHKNDRGGSTMYGVTELVARAHGYTGPMKDLPLAFAQAVYRKDYWDRLRLDDVAALSPRIAQELFDTGVNCGTGTAGTYFQRSLNVFNQQGKLYGDVAVDGSLGPNTVAKFAAYLKARAPDAEAVMLKALNSLQGAFYINISEGRAVNEDFTYGWFRARVVI